MACYLLKLTDLLLVSITTRLSHLLQDRSHLRPDVVAKLLLLLPLFDSMLAELHGIFHELLDGHLGGGACRLTWMDLICLQFQLHFQHDIIDVYIT